MESVEFNFFSVFVDKINNTLSSYVSDTSSNIISSISPTVSMLLTLFVAWWGWGMMRGEIQDVWSDALKRFARAGMVFWVATNVGLYNEFLADWLWRSPEALGELVAESNTQQTPQFLDAFLSKFYNLFQILTEAAKKNSTAFIPDISLTIIAILVLGAGVIVTGWAAVLLIASKMALALLLATGPIFVSLIMFDSTRRFFDAWIGQCLTCVFVVMLLAAELKFMVFFVQDYLIAATGEAVDPNTATAIPVIVMSAISTVIMAQIPSISSALGGGVAISDLGLSKATAQQGAYYGKKAVGKVASTTVNTINKGYAALKSRKVNSIRSM